MHMKALNQAVDLEYIRHALYSSMDTSTVDVVTNFIESCVVLLDSASSSGADKSKPTRALVIPVTAYEHAMESLETLIEVLDDK